MEGSSPGLAWERGLWAAFACNDPAERSALLHEELLELQWRAERWARVPRVCASISTSTGFLFASLALIQGLSAGAGGALPDVGHAVVPALDTLSISVAGASFCIAVHMRARRAAREWVRGVDRLIDRMEARRGEA